MEEAKLLALHATLKAGAPRGRVGGLGAGLQRGKEVVGGTGLPNNALYKYFVREGAELADVMVGVPKFAGTRMTFDEEGREEEAGAAKGAKRAGAAASATSSAAAAPAAAAGESEGEGEDGSGFSLKRMKRFLVGFVRSAKGGRARAKWARSAALEEAEDALDDDAAGALYDRALRKLLKKGKLTEEGELLVAAEGEAAAAEAPAAPAPAGKRKRERS